MNRGEEDMTTSAVKYYVFPAISSLSTRFPVNIWRSKKKTLQSIGSDTKCLTYETKTTTENNSLNNTHTHTHTRIHLDVDPHIKETQREELKLKSKENVPFPQFIKTIEILRNIHYQTISCTKCILWMKYPTSPNAHTNDVSANKVIIVIMIWRSRDWSLDFRYIGSIFTMVYSILWNLFLTLYQNTRGVQCDARVRTIDEILHFSQYMERKRGGGGYLEQIKNNNKNTTSSLSVMALSKWNSYIMPTKYDIQYNRPPELTAEATTPTTTKPHISSQITNRRFQIIQFKSRVFSLLLLLLQIFHHYYDYFGLVGLIRSSQPKFVNEILFP